MTASSRTTYRTCPAPWEPARPLGTRWSRLSDSVKLLVSVAGMATKGRTSDTR